MYENVCECVCTRLASHLPGTQCSWEKLLIVFNFDQDKGFTKDTRLL